MNNKVLYLALGVALMGTTSCSKKLGEFQSNYFNTTPTPLETGVPCTEPPANSRTGVAVTLAFFTMNLAGRLPVMVAGTF